ncbi:MAG: thiamine phosphate synthase [Nitrospirota bacterium]
MIKDPGFRLYLITDRKILHRRGQEDALLEALEGGVRAVQLREKDLSIMELLDMAYRLRELTDRYNARLFINDRIDIALAAGADGVHLGNSSIPAKAARKAAGGKMLIGVSTHSIEEAKKAERDGADFITLGPIYETPSKMEYGRPLGTEILNRAKKEISVPIFAIGGINQDRVEEVLDSGAYGIALISAILASEDIKTTTERFMRLLG